MKVKQFYKMFTYSLSYPTELQSWHRTTQRTMLYGNRVMTLAPPNAGVCVCREIVPESVKSPP